MIKERIVDYLRMEPKFRERSNKDRGMVNLLMEKYGNLKVAIDNGVVSKETIISCLQEYASMDRAWRQALENNESLRGSDYEDKEELEKIKLKELGYNV